MTKDRYLELCEQVGDEPKEEKMPPELDDFPYDVQKAIIIYNKLGDKVVADVGYLGKDYTNVEVYMDIEGVSNKFLFMETLLRLDTRVITKAAEKRKREIERMKNSAKTH